MPSDARAPAGTPHGPASAGGFVEPRAGRDLTARCRVAWDGTLLGCNEAFARLVGAGSRTSVIGQSVEPLYVNPELRPRLLARLAAEGTVANTSLRLRAWSGRMIWVHATATRVIGEDGRPEVEAMAIDITDLKTAADALLEREAQLAAVIRTAGVPVICTDLEQRIVEFNPAAERLLGLGRSKALGRLYGSLFPEALRRKIARDMDRIAAGEIVEAFENTIERPDGTRGVVLWNMQPIVDRDGRTHGVAVVGQDITGRQWAEEALFGQARILSLLSERLAGLSSPGELQDVRSEIDRAATALRVHLSGRAFTAEPLDRLTPREREVFLHLAQGLTNGDIARMLDVSVRTVETHRAHLMAKLGLRGPRELLQYAVRRSIGPFDS